MKLLRSSARIQNAMRGNRLPESVIRLCVGISIGMCLAFAIYTGGGGTKAEFGYRNFSHPITNGASLGLSFSIPIGILYYLWRRIRHSKAKRRGRPEPPFPRYLLRTSLAVTCVATLILLRILDQ